MGPARPDIFNRDQLPESLNPYNRPGAARVEYLGKVNPLQLNFIRALVIPPRSPVSGRRPPAARKSIREP